MYVSKNVFDLSITVQPLIIKKHKMNRFGFQLSQNCNQKLPDQLTNNFIHLIFIFLAQQSQWTRCNNRQTQL